MDPRPIELHPEAIAEGRDARTWYEECNQSTSAAFMAELDTAIDSICESPDRWPTYLHGTRRYLLKRFPYLVVYRELSDKLQVLTIAHAKRTPGYWRHRVK